MSATNKILALLEDRNISARKLTMDLNLANSSVTEWKKGKARPSIEAIIKIANYFGVTTDYLLLDNEEDTGIPNETGGIKTERVQEESEVTEIVSGTSQEANTRMESNVSQEPDTGKITLSKEDKKLLRYFHRLDENDKEYILCKIIVLEREYAD